MGVDGWDTNVRSQTEYGGGEHSKEASTTQEELHPSPSALQFGPFRFSFEGVRLTGSVHPPDILCGMQCNIKPCPQGCAQPGESNIPCPLERETLPLHGIGKTLAWFKKFSD